jgi:hypothetical protein
VNSKLALNEIPPIENLDNEMSGGVRLIQLLVSDGPYLEPIRLYHKIIHYKNTHVPIFILQSIKLIPFLSVDLA